jgi:hypothetical protein
MSLNIHFLYSHLDFFPETLGEVSDEQSEHFHQILSQWNITIMVSMMADYCWMLYCDAPDMMYHRKRKSSH